jgi:anti-sigma factor RsiW
MSNLLQQLENNEGILMMYLAGELLDVDRAEVEQMLAADPALRAELSDLTALHEGVTTLLGRSEVPASRADAAARFVGRAMAARTAATSSPALRTNGAVAISSATDDPAEEPARRGRFARLAYPVAAAALLVIGVMIYNGHRPATPGAPDNAMPNFPGDGQQFARLPTIIPESDLAPLEEEGLSLRTQSGSGFFSESIDAGDLDR